MSKIFRAMSAPPNENMANNSGKMPFDPSVWQLHEGGDYVNTKTGEIRDEDAFNFDDTGDDASDVFAEEWSVSSRYSTPGKDGRVTAADIVRENGAARTVGKRAG